jgi:hypothetical protein
MARYKWLVFTNAAPGREEAFNRWYDEVHIADLLRVPGIVGARRSALTQAQLTMETGDPELCGPERIGAKHRFLAVYEIEADDPMPVLEEIRTRANTADMPITPDLAEAWTVLYRDF